MSGLHSSRGRSFLRRMLAAVLPEDAWSAEFLGELDESLARRAEQVGGGGLRLTLWYLRQIASPQTLQFVGAVRQRERKKRKANMRTKTSRVLLAGLGTDAKQAWRSVVRDPWAAILIVMTLALGIGSVTAMYGLGERLFLKGPLHVAAPERVVRLFLEFNEEGGDRTSPWLPYRTGRALQDETSLFSALSLYRLPEELVDFGERVRPLELAEVDGRYFDLLGVVPEAGRFFRGDPPPDPGMAVLSHRTAVEEFGSAEAALGRAIRVGDRVQTVMGVAPRGFAGPNLNRVDVWIPLNERLAANTNWWITGRLREGVSVQAAEAEAEAVHQATDPGRFFQWAREGTVGVAGVDADLAGSRSVETSIAGLLLGVVGLVLLISWINVLNLLLARVTRRGGEIIVRLALGIGRWRLVRLLLAESLLLSLGGGLLSLPVAYLEGLVVRHFLLPGVAWDGSALDLKLLAVTFLVVLISGAILGVLPARHANRTDITRGLNSGRQGARAGATRLQTILATSQITFSAALLLCAGLFVKSFWTIRVTDLGVDADRVRVVTLRSLEENRGTWEERAARADREDASYEMALDWLRDRGDGTRIALSVGLPFFANFGKSVHVDGRDSIPELPGGGPFVSMVSDGYFETVGTRILRGTGITAAHVASGEQVAVIGAATARTLWPDGNALGQCVRLGTESDPCLRVIGVAEDVHRQGYREPPSMQIYLPMGSTQDFRGPALLIRPARGEGAYESLLTAELSRLAPGIDFVDVRRLDSFLDAEIRPWRLGAVMLSMVGALAIAMSLGGVFGVLTYVVAQRRREIGVRIALGATRFSIQKLVLRLGLVSGVLGVAIGFVGVMAASRWLGPLLFETSVADPPVMLGVGGGLIGVALLACLVPAGQAARVDPAKSLRAEV